jgi:hypothetical protein
MNYFLNFNLDHFPQSYNQTSTQNFIDEELTLNPLQLQDDPTDGKMEIKNVVPEKNSNWLK